MPDRRPHVLKMYDVVRTAHLERVLADDRREITILYRSRRYDFDDTIASQVTLERAGVTGAFLHAFRHDLDFIEVNEPLMVEGAGRGIAAVLGNRLRAALRRGPRARVVTYAIENRDPRLSMLHLPAKARLRTRLGSMLLPLQWGVLDRIAFGTDQSRELYTNRFRSRRPLSRTVPALPVARRDVEVDVVRDPILLFLGDLSERKGFPLLLRAWPDVSTTRPRAELIIVGRGAGTPDAKELASGDGAVTFIEDPPRSEVLRQLGRAKCLVLPSQPRTTWREQVGLPIVEGLAAGCAVVTTTQTGLADWLRAHGHHVVDESAGSRELAEVVATALDSARTPREIQSDLPVVDGRLAAEEWLLATDDGDVRP